MKKYEGQMKEENLTSPNPSFQGGGLSFRSNVRVMHQLSPLKGGVAEGRGGHFLMHRMMTAEFMNQVKVLQK